MAITKNLFPLILISLVSASIVHATHIDNFYDPLPEGAICRIGTPKNTHEIAVASLSLSNDGKFIVSQGCSNDATFVWDAASGQKNKILPRIFGSNFTPIENELVSTRGSSLCTYDILTQTKKYCLSHKGGYIAKYDYSASAEMLATVGEPRDIDDHGTYEGTNSFWIWNIPKREPILKLDLGGDSVQNVKFSPNEDLVAIALKASKKKIYSAGKTLKGTRNLILLLNPLTGQQIHSLNYKNSASYSLSFSPDGNILASVQSGKIIFWDIKTGGIVSEKETGTPNSHFIKVAFSLDGSQILTLANTRLEDTKQSITVATIWSANNFIKISENIFKDYDEHLSNIYETPSGDFVSFGVIGNRKRFYLQNLSTGAEHLRYNEGHSSDTQALAFLDNGQTLATYGSENKIKLWDIKTQDLINTISFNPPNFNCRHNCGIYFSISRNEKYILTASNLHDGKQYPPSGMNLFDIKTGKLLRKLEGIPQGQTYRHPLFSPNSQLIASGCSDKNIYIYDINSGEIINILKGNNGDLKQMIFSPLKPEIITLSPEGGSGNNIRIWSLEIGTFHSILKQDSSNLKFWINKIILSNDGNYLVANISENVIDDQRPYLGKISRIVVYDYKQNKELLRFTPSPISDYGYSVSPHGMAISNDNKYLILQQGMNLHFYSLTTGELLKTVTDPNITFWDPIIVSTNHDSLFTVNTQYNHAVVFDLNLIFDQEHPTKASTRRQEAQRL